MLLGFYLIFGNLLQREQFREEQESGDEGTGSAPPRPGWEGSSVHLPPRSWLCGLGICCLCPAELGGLSTAAPGDARGTCHASLWFLSLWPGPALPLNPLGPQDRNTGQCLQTEVPAPSHVVGHFRASGVVSVESIFSGSKMFTARKVGEGQ